MIIIPEKIIGGVKVYFGALITPEMSQYVTRKMFDDFGRELLANTAGLFRARQLREYQETKDKGKALQAYFSFLNDALIEQIYGPPVPVFP